MEDTTGARLRRARERRNLSVAQVSETTRIRPQYLQALEDDDLSSVPSTAQARGFLRIYAEFLGIKPEDFVPAMPVSKNLVTPSSDGPRDLKSDFKIGRSRFLETIRLGWAARGAKGKQAGDGELLQGPHGATASNGARRLPPRATPTSDLTEAKKKARR